MGAKPSQPPPPSPTFREDWRKMKWGNKDNDLQYVKNYKPYNKKVQHIRILLQGPVGAGKSSFINSVDSVLQDRMTGRALTVAATSKSFTKKYKTYQIHKENPGNAYPFIFTDFMGLEQSTDSGACVENIKLAMQGHVREGYKFNSVSPLAEGDEGYNRNPTPGDKVHVLVYVISAEKACLTSDEVLQKMKEVRNAASDMDIPQVAILTHIDKVCAEVQTNIRNVYKSKHLKKNMEELSAELGIPLNCIFPVKNYHSIINTNDDTDVLILSALKQMIYFGEDFLNSLYPDTHTADKTKLS
ncbi:hypothetical protein LDENG_00272510 [Lucifuga dentata]|nr:hypothetical protein LDENG_00272510 [Lucifuga dentata]